MVTWCASSCFATCFNSLPKGTVQLSFRFLNYLNELREKMQRLMRDEAHHLPSRAFGCLKGRRRGTSENFPARCTVPHTEGRALRLCRSCWPCPGTGHPLSNWGLHHVPHFSTCRYSQTSQFAETWRRAGSSVWLVVLWTAICMLL